MRARWWILLGSLALVLAGVPAFAQEAAKTLTAADKKEMDRIVREFVDGDAAKRKDLLFEAEKYSGIGWKDFQPIADKILKLKRKPVGKGNGQRETIALDVINTWTYQVKTGGGYTPGKPAPVLIFLHGFKGYDRMEDWLNAASGGGFIAVTPLSPNGWWDRAETDLLFFEMLRLVRRNYSVDGNRVYLVGFNQGGCGAWYYGLRYPHLLAAAVPMAGTVAPGNEQFEMATHVPFSVWHGEKDQEYPAENEKKAVEALVALGYKAQYKEFPGGTVSDWYQKDLNGIQKEIMAWLNKAKRNPAPEKVVWARKAIRQGVFPPAVEWPNGCYWIEVPDADKTAKVTAERPAKGKFKLTTEKVRTVAVLLNPTLADLAAPVEVEFDGKPAHSGVVLCSLNTLLRTWGMWEDPDLTYVAELKVTKPQ